MPHITHLTLRLATLQVQRSMARIISGDFAPPDATRYFGQLAIHGANGQIIDNVSTGEGKGKTIAAPKGHAALTKSLHVARATAARIHGEGHPIVTHLDRAIKAADKVTADAKSGKTSKPKASVVKSTAPAKLIAKGDITDEKVSPYGDLNPRIIHKLYGTSQLKTALGEYTHVSLKEAAQSISTKSGTPLPKMSSKAAVIAYIHDHTVAAHPEYPA